MSKKNLELRDQLHRLKQIRESLTPVRFMGVITSLKDAKEFKERFCSGCGREKKNPKLYFGELFCHDCVEKWQAGKR